MVQNEWLTHAGRVLKGHKNKAVTSVATNIQNKRNAMLDKELTYTPNSEAAETAKHCPYCLVLKPASEFRRRGRVARVRQCRSCHNEAERTRRSANRKATRNKTLRNRLTRLRQAPTERLVGVICEEMVREFGGVDAFLGAWRGCLREDMSRGGLAAFRHLDCVIRLTQYCEQHRPDYGRFTDSELEAAICALQGHPAITDPLGVV